MVTYVLYLFPISTEEKLFEILGCFTKDLYDMLQNYTKLLKYI